jgi:hypothetical protein
MFLLPQSMNTPDTNHPARLEQFRVNTLATKTRTNVSDPSHRLQQRSVLRRLNRPIPLRAAWLTQRPACPSLRYSVMPQATTHSIDRPTSLLRANQFGRAASLRIWMSNAWSATSLATICSALCRFFKRGILSGPLAGWMLSQSLDQISRRGAHLISERIIWQCL